MGLNKESRMKLSWIKDIISDLWDYHPFTIRQLYYQLVGRDLIENNSNTYNNVCKLLTKARMQGLLDWDIIIDRTRVYKPNFGFKHIEQFIGYQAENMMEVYRRDLMQNQPYYIEIWVEKDALFTIFQGIANEYTIPLVICKGYSSVTFLNNYYERAVTKDKPLLILYYGDFDPSGLDMLRNYRKKLTIDFGLDVYVDMGALKYEHIQQYNFPINPNAIKPKDKKSKAFIQKYGNVSVELDAMDPLVLQGILKMDLAKYIDLEEYQKQCSKHWDDKIQLAKNKDDVIKYLIELFKNSDHSN